MDNDLLFYRATEYVSGMPEKSMSAAITSFSGRLAAWGEIAKKKKQSKLRAVNNNSMPT